MIDKPVRQAKMQNRRDHRMGGKRLRDCSPRAAHHTTLFKCHEAEWMLSRHLEHQLCIDRLDKAHIHHGEVKYLSRFESGRQKRAKHQHRQARTSPANDASPQRNGIQTCSHYRTRTGTSGVTHGSGARVVITG